MDDADEIRAIATEAMTTSVAGILVVYPGSAEELWKAAATALAAHGYVIRKREEHFGR